MVQSQKHDIVVIGCGSGGATAAQFAKKTDRKAQVTIFERSPFPEYSKCGIPYAISGEIPNVMDLIEFSEEWFQKARIDLHLNNTVKEIDPEKKIITAENKDGSIIKKQYTSLIIGTGANPLVPPIKNMINENTHKLKKNIFTVRTIPDAKEISAAMNTGKNAVVVGAGLIGLEMADTLHKKGLHVTLVEALPYMLNNVLDKDMSDIIHEKMKESITIYLNTCATEVKTDENEILSSVIINDYNKDVEKEIAADLLIIAAGVKPETSLAENAGCKIGSTGAIKVNERSQTTQQDIYAVGDCTEYVDFITKRPIQVGLGSISVRQGIAAGINAAGGDYTLPRGVLQTATSTFFDSEIASVGPSLGSLKDIDTVVGKYSGLSRPDYFPGGKPITMKTIVNAESGKIIGAQAVGENAAQRINTYATAILSELSIDTFKKLETAYAPPIAPTLDVVTLVADVASLKWNRKKQ